MKVHTKVKAIVVEPPNEVDEWLVRVATLEGTWAKTHSYLCRRVVLAMLKKTRGNQVAAAEMLGMHRNTLGRILGGK